MMITNQQMNEMRERAADREEERAERRMRLEEQREDRRMQVQMQQQMLTTMMLMMGGRNVFQTIPPSIPPMQSTHPMQSTRDSDENYDQWKEDETEEGLIKGVL